MRITLGNQQVQFGNKNAINNPFGSEQVYHAGSANAKNREKIRKISEEALKEFAKRDDVQPDFKTIAVENKKGRVDVLVQYQLNDKAELPKPIA